MAVAPSTPAGDTETYRRRWLETGWCVVEGVIPPDALADAQEALTQAFPTAEDFADGVDPARNAPFFSEQHAPRLQFPFAHPALNRVALHDAVLDLAATLLETADPRVYQAGVAAKYSDSGPEYEQLLHADYANHTLVVPRTDVGYQHLETFIYLTDVTPSTGATRFVSREHTADIPIERTYLHLDDYAHLYDVGGTRVGTRGLGARVPARRLPPRGRHGGAAPGAFRDERRVQARRHGLDRVPRVSRTGRGHGVAPLRPRRVASPTRGARVPGPG